jgi:hypothetical protein
MAKVIIGMAAAKTAAAAGERTPAYTLHCTLLPLLHNSAKMASANDGIEESCGENISSKINRQ